MVKPWLLRCEDSVLRGSDFRRVGHIAQKVLEIAEKHKPDTYAQIVPILFSRTELGSAVLIAPIAQLQDLMDEEGQQVEDKKIVR